MVRLRFVLLGTVLILGALVNACGGDPPEKEMQQAQGAIDTARAAGAAQYAKEEFDAAVKALERARQAANDRDYRQSLNDALDSRERAQNSAKEAANNMAAARVDADRAIAAATTSLALVQKRLRELETAKTPARLLAGPRKSLGTADTRVQEARAAFDRGEYQAAITAASVSSGAMAEVGHALDAMTLPAARRGR